MSVVANVAINVDSRDAAAKLRQFQQQSTAAGRAAEQLQQGTTAAGQAAQGAGRQFQTAANGLKYYIDAAGRARKENGQLVSTVEAAAAGLKLQARAGDTASASLKRQSSEAQHAAQSTNRLSDAVRGLGASLLAQAAAAVAFQQVLRTAADFESTLSDISKTADTSDAKIAGIADTLAKMSAPTRTNLAPSVLAAGLQDLVAQGLELDAAVASLESLGKVAVATNSELTDVTKTGFQLQSALKIKPTELKATFDALAFAGKQGAFELKDMAQFMPTIASAATTLGITGKDGAIALAGMMQMVRKDAPGSAEAATRLTDALLKMTAPETVKNFQKFGVNIEAVLKNAVKEGVNPMDAAIKELIRITGNDQFKLSQIFGDKEAKLAIQALMKYRQEYEQLKKEAAGASGVIQRDFEKSLQTFNQQLSTLQGAGERLGIALGGALLPVVSKLINDVVGFANAVTGVVNAVNQLPEPIKNGAAELARLAVQALLLQKAIQGIIALRLALIGMLTATATSAGTAATAASGLTMNMRYLQGSMVQANAAASPLLATLRTIAAFGVITVGINLIVTGLQDALTAAAEVRRLRGERAAGGAAAIYGGSATTEQKATAKQTLAAVRKEQQRYRDPGTVAAQTLLGPFAPVFGVPTTAQAGARRPVLQERARRAEAVLGLPTRAAAVTTPIVPAGATAPTGAGTAAGGGRKGGKSEADKAAEAAKRQAEELNRSYELGTQLGTQFSRQLLLLDAATDQERRRLQIQFDYEDREKKISELKSKTQQANLRDLSNEQKRLERRQLDLEYLREQLTIFERIAGIDLSKTAELGKRAFDGAGGAFDPSLPDLRVSPAEQQMAAYREELAALTNPINMAVTGADAIGNAFGRAFQDIATGAKSTQEALASAFQGIGQAFIQMATQIIAKQLAMIAFQSILKVLGGGGSFSFSGASPAQLPSGGGFAEGFSMPALLPGRANGGPVTSGSPYVVGERGPELFVPGTGGSVVPTNDLRAAMGAAPGSGSSAPVLNMSFESTNIGGVEYVSRDQLEQAMAATRRQAANDGAKRGMSMTLDNIQQSPQTRRRLGIR